MSFFENRRILGFVLWLVGILIVADGIACIVAGITGDSNSFIPDDLNNRGMYAAISGIGAIISGLIYLIFSAGISRGMVSIKIDILAGLTRIVGLSTIIGGLFDGAALLVGGSDAVGAIVGTVISVLIGAIVIWVAGRINDGRRDVGDIIIWIVMLVLMVILVAALFLGLIGAAAAFDLGMVIIIVEIVARLIIYLFVIAFLFDREVRSQMGMAS